MDNAIKILAGFFLWAPHTNSINGLQTKPDDRSLAHPWPYGKNHIIYNTQVLSGVQEQRRNVPSKKVHEYLNNDVVTEMRCTKQMSILVIIKQLNRRRGIHMNRITVWIITALQLIKRRWRCGGGGGGVFFHGTTL